MREGGMMTCWSHMSYQRKQAKYITSARCRVEESDVNSRKNTKESYEAVTVKGGM